MENRDNSGYDLYDLESNPPNFEIEYGNGISEIRKFRENKALLEWRGKNGESIIKVSGRMSEIDGKTQADLILWIDNGNVLVFSSDKELAPDLLTAYSSESMYNIEERKKTHDGILNDSGISYMIIKEEIKNSIQDHGSMTQGIMKAYTERSSL